ncbi:hypothetical protein HBA94_15990 [Ochrobactrum sp. GRS2]|nr:hypothetical protein [Ochrobactrum sp. GRS2]
MKINQPRYSQIFRDNAEREELAILIWKEITSTLKEAGALTTVNLKRADRYVRASVEFESLYPIAAEEGPVTVGPNGGDVFNFNWAACEKLNDRLLKLEKAMFGEAVAKETGSKEKAGPTPSDEFLGSNNGLRQ